MLFLLVFDYDSAQDLVGVSYAESSRIRDRVEIEVEAEVSTNAKGLREAQGKAAKMKGNGKLCPLDVENTFLDLLARHFNQHSLIPFDDG
ncbi:uncharacterized protein JCM6883_005937 [Sporobolomyces salmoneus]|uniref:uncharacterized protein n=1 Tax=Sporobolomyces salmoneus TaxID=183962 RepID=UPI0031728A32